MKAHSLLLVALGAGLSVAALAPLTSAAKPTPPRKGDVRPPSTTHHKPPAKARNNTPGQSGLAPGSSHQPFGGRTEGFFRGTLVGIRVHKDGRFELLLRDPATPGPLATMRGCSMRLNHLPHIGMAIGRKSKTEVNYSSGCINFVTIK